MIFLSIQKYLYDRLKAELDIPIYSVISELPDYIKNKGYKKTLVMATKASINSHIYKKILDNEVIEVPCPKLVPIIESGNYQELDNALDEYLSNTEGVDSLVLGCTHYPIIKDYIKKKINDNVDIIDMGELLAKKIELIDSYKKIDLYFSKNSEKNDQYVNEILEIV